jgi:GDP-4-dehydro-6-deoxy-D-mannose reductase
MRVLVTGASGFVGRHLVPHLRARGHEIVAADVELDATDAPAVAAFIARTAPDAIVHLAGVSSVAISQKDPGLAFRVNYLGAHALLEATARHAPRARVLLVGTGEVYGSAAAGAPAFTEAAPMRPGSPYARSKAAADLLGASYHEQGLEVLRLRPFNHTGPGQSDVFVASSFARQLVEIERGTRADTIEVGNLDSVRDFLDVSDVIEAYARLLEPGPPAAVYNVASGRGVSAGALLECLSALAGLAPRIRVDSARFRPTDQSVGDASRLRAATGWAPKVPLEVTLEHLLSHWREELGAR